VRSLLAFQPDLLPRNPDVGRVKGNRKVGIMADNAEQLVSMAREAFSDLTAAEEEFFGRNAGGGFPDYWVGSKERDDPAHADQWGPERTVRAECIRWLCMTTKARPLVMGNRLRARGAKIKGALQLEYTTIDFVLAFCGCAFMGKITFEYATLRGLVFESTHVKSIYAPSMEASGSVHFCNGFVAVGTINLDSARISGDLRCDKSRLSYKQWPDDIQFSVDAREAFRASGLQVKGFVSFAESEVRGGVCLYQARIDGNLICDGSRFRNEDRNALLATGAKIGGAVYFARKFFALGQVNLEFTEIGGSLNCEGALFLQYPSIQNRTAQPPALNLESSDIKGSVYLKKWFFALGRVHFHGTKIGGHLDCVAAIGGNLECQGGPICQSYRARIRL
jgi:hypothetical protein